MEPELEIHDVNLPWRGALLQSTCATLKLGVITKPWSLMTSNENYPIFRECVSSAIVTRSEKPKAKRKTKVKRNGRKEVTVASSEVVTTERANPEELAEFIDVCFY